MVKARIVHVLEAGRLVYRVERRRWWRWVPVGESVPSYTAAAEVLLALRVEVTHKGTAPWTQLTGR